MSNRPIKGRINSRQLELAPNYIVAFREYHRDLTPVSDKENFILYHENPRQAIGFSEFRSVVFPRHFRCSHTTVDNFVHQSRIDSVVEKNQTKLKENEMTVAQLIEILSQLDPNKQVTLWDCEWDQKNPIDEIEVDQDGDVVIF